ncbi:hypothetical protein ABVT39_024542 [Epinephelus coioides]
METEREAHGGERDDGSDEEKKERGKRRGMERRWGGVDGSDSNHDGDNVDCDSDYDEEGNNGNDNGYLSRYMYCVSVTLLVVGGFAGRKMSSAVKQELILSRNDHRRLETMCRRCLSEPVKRCVLTQHRGAQRFPRTRTLKLRCGPGHRWAVQGRRRETMAGNVTSD